MNWCAFAGVVTLAFLLLNLLFGTAYEPLPGAIANTTPGSIWDGFFFSATIKPSESARGAKRSFRRSYVDDGIQLNRPFGWRRSH